MSPRGGKREGAGRPPKMGQPVEAGIKVNLTAEDRRALDLAAAERGEGPSELARKLILRGLRRIGPPAKRRKKKSP